MQKVSGSKSSKKLWQHTAYKLHAPRPRVHGKLGGGKKDEKRGEGKEKKKEHC